MLDDLSELFCFTSRDNLRLVFPASSRYCFDRFFSDENPT